MTKKYNSYHIRSPSIHLVYDSSLHLKQFPLHSVQLFLFLCHYVDKLILWFKLVTNESLYIYAIFLFDCAYLYSWDFAIITCKCHLRPNFENGLTTSGLMPSRKVLYSEHVGCKISDVLSVRSIGDVCWKKIIIRKLCWNFRYIYHFG